MKSLSLRSVIVCALASLLVALIAHQNMIRRGLDSDQTKVGVPIAGYSSDINDNYLYFSLIKRGAAACRDPAGDNEIDASGNPLACTYVPAIVADHLLYQTVRLVAPSRSAALGILLIVQTGLLAFAALILIQQILHRKLGPFAALLLAGGVIFLSDAFSWSLRFGTIYTNLPYIWRFEANVVRLVSPTVYWTIGLLAITALLALMEKPGLWRYIIAGLLLLLSSASSIAVGANIGAGVGFAFVFIAVVQRRIDFALLFGGVMLFLGLVWQEWFFSQFYKTEFGSQLGHGSFLGIHFDRSYLILLIPILFGRMGTLAGNRQIFLKALLFAAMLMGAFNGSVELGDRLWLRGAAMIAFVLSIGWAGWLIISLGSIFNLHLRLKAGITGTIAIICLTIALVGASAWIRPYDSQRWYGFVERDRYEAINWIAANSGPGDTVASPNIDDTNLIEFYTDATAFVGLYGMNALSFEELLRRYFFVVDLLANNNDVLGSLEAAKQTDLTAFFDYIEQQPHVPYAYDKYQVVGFYELLVYHSYNAAVANLFATGQVAASFIERMELARTEAARRDYPIKYLLLRNSDQLRSPQNFREVFRNSQYTILAPERTERAVSQ